MYKIVVDVLKLGDIWLILHEIVIPQLNYKGIQFKRLLFCDLLSLF